MQSSLFCKICIQPIPWYLYLCSFLSFCGVEVIITNYFSVSLGAIPIILLFGACLFLAKAFYYWIKAPVTPPASPSSNEPVSPSPATPNSHSSHKRLVIAIPLLCLCLVSSIACYYLGASFSADKAYSKGYEEGNTTGYDDGVASGYQSGYNLGVADGLQSGYDTGYGDGYKSGKLDALAESEANRQAAADSAAQEKAAAEKKRQEAIDAAKNDPVIREYIDKYSGAVDRFLDRGGYGSR